VVAVGVGVGGSGVMVDVGVSVGGRKVAVAVGDTGVDVTGGTPQAARVVMASNRTTLNKGLGFIRV